MTDSILPRLSEKEFKQFQRLIHEEAGIFLSDTKKALLVGRLTRRLRALELQSFTDYYRRVMEDKDRRELEQLLDCICTNETHFFREPFQFEFLKKRVFPSWQTSAKAGNRKRRIRIWSAACSTGEEPYSIAMLLLDTFGPVGEWELEIIATDLSTRALSTAKKAVWPIEKASEIPERYLKAFMLKGINDQAGTMKAGPEIRSLIQFHHMNLNEEAYGLTGPFDLIFCRNVLIYFSRDSRMGVIHRLIRLLAPTGYLLLGHAESLHAFSDRVVNIVPTVYASRPGSNGNYS